MPREKPFEFESENEILEMVVMKNPSLDSFFENQTSDLSKIVFESVSGNTFRAFSKLQHKPSGTFREWAQKAIERRKESLIKVLLTKNQHDYDVWLNELVVDLSKHWDMVMKQPMKYGQLRKLTNLLMKRLVLWNTISHNGRNELKQRLHVPFDRYVLLAMRKCINIIRIPANPSMSFIESEDVYYRLQNYIRELMEREHLPPIYFDILCWNITHPDST